MVKIPMPKAKAYSYQFEGGAYDGSLFVCGPGRPHVPPTKIEITDLKEGGISIDRSTVTHSYVFEKMNERYVPPVVPTRKPRKK